MLKVAFIENYDSFSYNIITLLQKLGADVQIIHNNSTLSHLCSLDFSHLVIGPGPCHPIDSKLCIDAVLHFMAYKKILGICLGHQAIAVALGGTVNPLPNPRHGKTECLYFKDNFLLAGIPQGIQIACYHSLFVSEVGSCKILGVDSKGITMVLKHTFYPCYGIQFHPESILAQKGKKILKNFLAL